MYVKREYTQNKRVFITIHVECLAFSDSSVQSRLLWFRACVFLTDKKRSNVVSIVNCLTDRLNRSCARFSLLIVAVEVNRYCGQIPTAALCRSVR